MFNVLYRQSIIIIIYGIQTRTTVGPTKPAKPSQLYTRTSHFNSHQGVSTSSSAPKNQPPPVQTYYYHYNSTGINQKATPTLEALNPNRSASPSTPLTSVPTSETLVQLVGPVRSSPDADPILLRLPPPSLASTH